MAKASQQWWPAWILNFNRFRAVVCGTVTGRKGGPKKTERRPRRLHLLADRVERRVLRMALNLFAPIACSWSRRSGRQGQLTPIKSAASGPATNAIATRNAA